MPTMEVKLRKALGSFKDQTSISIAKISSNGDPDLGVAVLKATSHDEVPIEERYVQKILFLTDDSRFNVSACVSALARRLNKTHNWIVAIKTLMLTHRLLCDGNPAFGQELSISGRVGTRFFSACDFRDDSHSNGWDFSAFVRSYGSYIDERLDCSFGSIVARVKPDRRPLKYEYSDSMYYARNSDGTYGSRQEDGARLQLVKDMQPRELMEKMPVFWRLLDRLLACRPTGPAKFHCLIHVALHLIVKESFLIYKDMRDGLAVLQDAFFDMKLQESGQILEIFSKAMKQIDELFTFYHLCKTLAVCKTVEYPHVEKIPEDLLETMEDCVRDSSSAWRATDERPKFAEPRQLEDMDDGPSYEFNGIKALPAPPHPLETPVPVVKDVLKQSTQNGSPLLNLKEPAMSSGEHENKLALALFSGPAETNVNSNGKTFSADQDVLEHGGDAGWELTLIESTSNLSKPNSNALALGGGFDNLLLDSLYEQGMYHRNMTVAMNPVGSASSVAAAGLMQSNFLALPAPSAAATALQEDPFAASVRVPPPPYVQMAEMRHKQQLLVQEQQLWMQYQQQGMCNITS